MKFVPGTDCRLPSTFYKWLVMNGTKVEILGVSVRNFGAQGLAFRVHHELWSGMWGVDCFEKWIVKSEERGEDVACRIFYAAPAIPA